jgi:hypothetical protein
MSYDLFKVIHLAGVIVFLGNIIVTGMWKVLEDRTGEPRVKRYRSRESIRTLGVIARLDRAIQ